jgi:hypothetical protein
MANLHSQFQKFEEQISISATQKKMIVERHSSLRNVIRNYLKQKSGIPVPDFYIQGSYKMNTMVQKKDGSFDVDLGVFFNQRPMVTSTTVQSYVLNAVQNQTASGAQHLKKCIRVNYADGFNADLPVYYQVGSSGQSHIAVKNGDWVKDDPEKFVNWVIDHRKSKEINNDGQLLRIIKYLKIWTNLQSFKTPSGAAMTVWVCQNFKPCKDRDDIALSKTINEIHSNLFLFMSCLCPVEPFDDLINNLDSTQKNKFKEALVKLMDDANNALSSTDTTLAVSYLSKHLGNKFKI